MQILFILLDAHPQQSPLTELLKGIPAVYKYGALFAAVLFIWGKYEASKKRSSTGSGITTMSADEQLVNFVGTQQMSGQTIVHIEQTDEGFDAVTRDENGDETGWSVERREF